MGIGTSPSIRTFYTITRHRKLTSLLTALPAVLAHSEQIRFAAMVMSITGGLLIYGTIISFSMFFQEEQEF